MLILEKSWYNLNIDISNALHKDWVFPDLEKSHVFFATTEKLFNLEWVSYMESLGIFLGNRHLIFFKKSSMQENTAHVDLGSENYAIPFALNWAIGGNGSKMYWYKEKTKGTEIKKQNIWGTPEHKKLITIFWKLSDLEKIDVCELKSSLVLVRVDIPHNVLLGDEDRWSISVRLNYHKLDIHTWENAVNFLTNKNLLILS